MTMETLAKLFGSAAKVKIIRLFLFNPDSPYGLLDISEKSKESPAKVRAEMGNLEKLGLVRRKVFYKTQNKKRGKKILNKRVKVRGWTLNRDFTYRVSLQNFLTSLYQQGSRDMVRKFSKAGNIKLIIISGVFIQDPESRIDLLVVGDHLRRGSIEGVIRSVEAEMGRELRYSIFETSDFLYRLGMYDKLIRDILDYPHTKLVNKIGSI